MDINGPWDLSSESLSRKDFFQSILSHAEGKYSCVTAAPEDFSVFFVIEKPWRGVKCTFKGQKLHWSHSFPFFDNSNLIVQLIMSVPFFLFWPLTLPIVTGLYAYNTYSLQPILKVIDEGIKKSVYGNSSCTEPCLSELTDDTENTMNSAEETTKILSTTVSRKNTNKEVTDTKKLEKLKELLKLGIYSEKDFLTRQKSILGEKNE